MMGGDLTDLDQSWFITSIFSIISVIVYVLYIQNKLSENVNSTFIESIEVYIIFIAGNMLYNLSLGNFFIERDVLEVSTSWSIGLLLSNVFIKNVLKIQSKY